ncbi:hypothetical protein CAEBREN_06955 [Caenorhabditis brenneri]|uniref:Seven TM Receptor n=1 Tax=Caenorhabditis brenneri TaxID=135651 RepID=G0MIZ4_CAEBE|nr:hypothetical protein CAEBREN_06955 [Caenorhabditis brenneri]
MANTTEKQLFLKTELEDFYEENSEMVSFIAPMYWSIGENQEKIWKFGEVLSSVGCVMIILICFSTIVFCAVNIYLQLKHTSAQLSTKTFDLHQQLFVTLVFQTLLPFIMMYSPVGLLITLPFFEISVGRAANYVGASLAVYPSLEPLIALFCIKDFRKTVFCCIKEEPAHPSNISMFTRTQVHC